jgi:REP element-mobilizing transposase RayT
VEQQGGVMRRPRIKLDGAGFYHCISRVVAGEHLFDDQAKDVLRSMIWQVAAFSGVEVVAYCILSNHFHVLIRVQPATNDVFPDPALLLERYRQLYSRQDGALRDYPSPEALQVTLARGGDEAEQWKLRLQRRMGDVSEFMKTLKQRFTTWFNHSHGRFGTLWSERFKSILVQNHPETLQTIAAYIDLNPVRAGLVADPAEYRWCSYADAMSGKPRAQAGLSLVVDCPNPGDLLAAYRLVLFGKGATTRTESVHKIPSTRVAEILRKQGKLSREEFLRQRQPTLNNGLVFGLPEWVQSHSQDPTSVSMLTNLASSETAPLATLRRSRHCSKT